MVLLSLRWEGWYLLGESVASSALSPLYKCVELQPHVVPLKTIKSHQDCVLGQNDVCGKSVSALFFSLCIPKSDRCLSAGYKSAANKPCVGLRGFSSLMKAEPSFPLFPQQWMREQLVISWYKSPLILDPRHSRTQGSMAPYLFCSSCLKWQRQGGPLSSRGSSVAKPVSFSSVKAELELARRKPQAPAQKPGSICWCQ